MQARGLAPAAVLHDRSALGDASLPGLWRTLHTKRYCMKQADSCYKSLNRIFQAASNANTYPVLHYQQLTMIQV